MQKTITLKEAAEKFQIWRSQQKSKAPRFPDDLKSIIIQLSKRHKQSLLTKTLKSRQTLYTIREKHCADKKNKPLTPTIDFMPFKAITPTSDATPNNCEIIKTDGTKLIITSADISSIIKVFLCSK